MPTLPRVTAAGLKRVFGLGFGLAIAVGGTAGTGVLTSPGELVHALHAPGYVMIFWAIGGLYTLLAANTVAELASRLPQAGGWYGYTSAAFGEFPAVVVAWADWTSSCVTGALVALLLGEYAAQLLAWPVPHLALWLAGTAVLGCSGFQWWSVQAGSRLQELTAGILLLVVLGLLAGSYRGAAPGSIPLPSRVVPTGTQFVAALQVVVFAYDGWYAPIYFAEETQAAGRTLPRALLGGVGLVLGLYLLLNAVLLWQIPFAQFHAADLPLTVLATNLVGPFGHYFLLLLGVVALLGVLNSVLLMGTRVLFALSRDKQLPASIARVSTSGTPRWALLVATLLTVALGLSNTVSALEAITSMLFVGYYTVGFLALFRVRRLALLNASSPIYHAWGHPWTTGGLVVASLGFLGVNALLDPGHALIAVGLIVGAWPLWRWARWRSTRKGLVD